MENKKNTYNHFGEKVIFRKYKLNLNREDYVNKPNINTLGFMGGQYSDEEIEKLKENALKNYDINMEFFELLDVNEFEEAIEEFFKKFKKFKEIKDLKSLDNVKGSYIIVLDNYKQLYIGQTNNIRKRIKEHWSSRKALDRLVFGGVENSKISIDSFRAFDTTRIFVDISNRKNLLEMEKEYIENFPNKFLCNRTAGGLKNGLGSAIKYQKNRMD